MTRELELNRYVALFQDALERHWLFDRDGQIAAFTAQLLQRLNVKLSAEGKPPERIAEEMRLAAEAARIAEDNLRRQGLSARTIVEGPAQPGSVPDKAVGKSGPRRRALRTFLLFLLSFLCVVTYCAVNIMFAFEHRHVATTPSAKAPSTMLAIDVGIADFNNQKLVLHLLPIGGEFVNKDGKLLKDVTLKVEGGDGFITHTFLANSLQPPMSATVEIDSGDLQNYPFDQYQAEIDIEASIDGKAIPFRTVLDDIPHNLNVTLREDASNADDVGDILTLSRSGVEMFVIALSVISLVVVVVCSIWIAVYVVVSNRKFEFDILVWTAALLFVIPTMRDALPGEPPYGSAIDFMVFFWLQAAVAVATIILVWSWIRRE